MRLKLEKEAERRHEAWLIERNNKCQPSGRGGCGAPLRDSKGNLISMSNSLKFGP